MKLEKQKNYTAFHAKTIFENNPSLRAFCFTPESGGEKKRVPLYLCSYTSSYVRHFRTFIEIRRKGYKGAGARGRERKLKIHCKKSYNFAIIFFSLPSFKNFPKYWKFSVQKFVTSGLFFHNSLLLFPSLYLLCIYMFLDDVAKKLKFMLYEDGKFLIMFTMRCIHDRKISRIRVSPA